jgi:signal transduction histidine kinase
MVVQAGGARRTLERNPHRAAEALETVEITGRAALDELRRLLGFVGEGSASLEPQPTTGDLPALAARARAAGLPVELVMDGEPRRLPTGAEIAAYRIVQEALTNALKHAGPGARATVALRWSASRLELEIRDTGGTAHVVPQLPESGHGLVGMRERVALYGGTLTAGRLDDGGFAVRARLPVESAGVPA